MWTERKLARSFFRPNFFEIDLFGLMVPQALAGRTKSSIFISLNIDLAKQMWLKA